MRHLPETGYLRLMQIIGDPSATPAIPAIIPVSRSTWWAGVKAGRYPPAVKISSRASAWRVEDIRALIEDPESWAWRRSGATSAEKDHA